tara:strand:+ start:20744 stop:20929 length:186 start_codon:yes stop_codon:yes gene_type:complete
MVNYTINSFPENGKVDLNSLLEFKDGRVLNKKKPIVAITSRSSWNCLSKTVIYPNKNKIFP